MLVVLVLRWSPLSTMVLIIVIVACVGVCVSDDPSCDVCQCDEVMSVCDVSVNFFFIDTLFDG